MTNIIQFDQYKRKKLGKNGFKYWNAQFKQSFDESTTLADLPDNIILFLASPGDKSTGAIYQLIEVIRFPETKSTETTEIKQKELDLIDTHLFLVDNIRFEMMLRLGWIGEYPGMDKTLLDLILDFDKNKTVFDNPPDLSPDHPRLQEYEELIPREKELFIRKLFVNALIEFNRKVND